MKSAKQRRLVRQQQDARVRAAVRRAHLADRTPQSRDLWEEYRQQEQRGWSR